MSTDEIRKLVRIYSAKEKNLKHELEKFNEAEMTPNLENISIARNDAIMTIHALLDYARMVERCEWQKSHLDGLLGNKDYELTGVTLRQVIDTEKSIVDYILHGDAGKELKMATGNKTVADIVNETKSAIDYGNGVLLDLAGKQAIGILDRIEAAHKREIEELNFKLMTSKSEQKTAANVIIEQTNKVEKLEREIAELRELLIELANAANTAFDDIAKCGSIIADGDVRDAAYRTHLMERIAKYRQALKGGRK